MILIMIGAVSAELMTVETDINLQVDNRSITVTTEDKEYSFSCGDGAVSPGKKTIQFTREFTCENADELRQIASVLSGNMNKSLKYYDLYLDCYAAEKLCEQKLSINSGNATVNYLAKYEEAFENYNNCKSDKNSYITARQQAESQLSTCETEKKTSNDQKLLWGIGGLLIGGFGYMFLFDKSRKKPAISAAEAQLPRNR